MKSVLQGYNSGNGKEGVHKSGPTVIVVNFIVQSCININTIAVLIKIFVLFIFQQMALLEECSQSFLFGPALFKILSGVNIHQYEHTLLNFSSFFLLSFCILLSMGKCIYHAHIHVTYAYKHYKFGRNNSGDHSSILYIFLFLFACNCFPTSQTFHWLL